MNVNVRIWKFFLRFLENQLHRKVETCVESLKASSWHWFECVQIMISEETAWSQLGTDMYTRFSQELKILSFMHLWTTFMLCSSIYALGIKMG